MIPASYLFKTVYDDAWTRPTPPAHQNEPPPQTGQPTAIMPFIAAVLGIFRRPMVTIR